MSEKAVPSSEELSMMARAMKRPLDSDSQTFDHWLKIAKAKLAKAQAEAHKEAGENPNDLVMVLPKRLSFLARVHTKQVEERIGMHIAELAASEWHQTYDEPSPVSHVVESTKPFAALDAARREAARKERE